MPVVGIATAMFQIIGFILMAIGLALKRYGAISFIPVTQTRQMPQPLPYI